MSAEINPKQSDGRSPSLIVAGGGTGGHVLAGIAIADAWRERFPDAGKEAGKRSSILFVGARGGIEEKLVPRAGYPLELLEIGSLKRVSLGRRLKTMFQLPFSMLRSLAILARMKPAAVVGVGGYASGPLVLMARAVSWIWGGKVAILEQNAVPGFTNRILGRVSHRIFSAFPGTEPYFAGKSVQVTGNPIRTSMKPLSPASQDPFTVFIFGGSQGAVPVNTLVLEALPHLKEVSGRLCFIHQTGERDYERVLKAHQAAGTHARVEKFIHDMPTCYSEASLLICRAGSSTLAEVAAVGRAAILIPLPTAADNHQEKNARVFADAGGAIVLVQNQSDGKKLADMIRGLMAEPSRIQTIENAVKAFYRPRAAMDVVSALNN